MTYNIFSFCQQSLFKLLEHEKVNISCFYFYLFLYHLEKDEIIDSFGNLGDFFSIIEIPKQLFEVLPTLVYVLCPQWQDKIDERKML